jgi:uncharacterized protein (UPF0276 family)
VGLSLGSANGLDPWHLERLERLVQRIEPCRVSDHACFARGTWRSPSGPAPVHAADLLPVPFSDESLAVMASNIQQVQEKLGRSIAVENLSAYVQWVGDTMDEPSFLAHLAKRTGCSLLVDVNNLYVNALNQQLQDPGVTAEQVCVDWLDAVPAHVVGEIHLAGHTHCGDIVIDDHASRVCDAVWALYKHAIRRFGAVPTLLEWDTDIPALDVLLGEARLADAIAGAECASDARPPDADRARPRGAAERPR